MNDSIFTKMMLSLQENKAIEAKKNLKALKESKLAEDTEVEINIKDTEAPAEDLGVEPVEECEEGEGLTEDISQDSQIKTVNKGQSIKELDGIEPATGEDGVPETAVDDKKLDEENPDADPEIDANLDAAAKETKLESEVTVNVDDKTIEVADDKITVTTNAEEVCPECGEEECICEPEEEVIEEPAEELEVIEEPEEEEEIEEEPIEEEEDEFIDESTFNPFLNKFIKDNYSNAKNVKIESVKMNNKQLTLECKLTFNSGRTSKFNLGLRGIVREGRVCKLRGYDNGYFKAEAVKAPLTFKVSYRNNTLRCEGLEYNFNTRLTEGKIKNIKGKLIVK